MEGSRIRARAAGRALLVALAAMAVIGSAVRTAPSSAAPPSPLTTYLVVLDTLPVGLDVVLDGMTVTTPWIFECVAGSTHSLGVASPQPEGPGTRYVFRMWSDGTPQPNRVFTCDAPASYTALFDTEYYVTIIADFGTTSPPSGWYAAGTVLAIEWMAPPPEPRVRYTFGGWVGSGAGSYTGANNPAAISVAGPITEHAVVVREFLFVFDTNPTGLTMTFDGVSVIAPQALWWAEGSSHIVACPDQGPGGNSTYVFREWDDGVTDNPRVFVARGPESRTCFYDHGPAPVPVNANESRFGLPIIPDPGIPSLVGLAPPNPAASRWAALGIRSPLPERPPTG